MKKFVSVIALALLVTVFSLNGDTPIGGSPQKLNGEPGDPPIGG